MRVDAVWCRISYLLLFALAAAGTPTSARPLSFEERIEAQRAIERVYHGHAIGTRAAFEEAVPLAVIESKVHRYLAQSAALEELWGTRITDEALVREVERMAAGTRMPHRLRELFAALDDDPLRVAECLARPILAERLLRSFVSSDMRIHRAARTEASRLREELERGVRDPRAADARRAVIHVTRGDSDPQPYSRMRREMSTGDVSPVDEREDAFFVRVLLDAGDADDDAMEIAEYRVPKIFFDV